MMRKCSIMSLLLAFCLCFAMAVPAFAAETDAYGKVMPVDVVYALEEPNLLSVEQSSNFLNDISKETSLGIDMYNIDMKTFIKHIHCLRNR